MKEKITPYLRKMLHNPAIALQYMVLANEKTDSIYNDPLMEDEHEVTKGLIHKYDNRALIKVSYQCAAHCRFCTRIRQIGNVEGTLNDQNIAEIIVYLINNPQINDVILSGGDPFYTPKITLKLLTELSKIQSIKVIRIGTRMVFQSPFSFKSKVFNALFEMIKKIATEKPFFVLIHIEHPDELTEEATAVIKFFKKMGVTLLAQSVFLKNINDNVEILFEMYTKLYHLGVLPYYLYHCDNVKGIEHFKGDKLFEKNIAIALRKRLSGIAMPLFVEDIENGYGKIPV